MKFLVSKSEINNILSTRGLEASKASTIKMVDTTFESVTQSNDGFYYQSIFSRKASAIVEEHLGQLRQLWMSRVDQVVQVLVDTEATSEYYISANLFKRHEMEKKAGEAMERIHAFLRSEWDTSCDLVDLPMVSSSCNSNVQG